MRNSGKYPIILFLTLLFLFTCVFSHAKIQLNVWGFPEDELWVGVQKQAKEFEKLHPEVEVVMGSPGGRGTMDPQKLMTAIAGGTPPDVIWQDRFTISGWASRGAFRSLDDLIARDSINPNDFYKATWEEASYQGHVYALPYGTDCRALFYNRSLFREVGLDPDKPPKTWKDLETYTKKLNKFENGKPVRMGFIPNFGNCWLYLYGWQNGGEFMSPNGRTCTLNDPKIVEALQWMTNFYDMLGGRAKVVSGFEAGFQGLATDAFLIGKVAMKVDGNWNLDNIIRYAPNLDFGVAPPPVPDDKPVITWSGGFSLVIPKGSHHVNEAWEFIKWMNSYEGNIFAGERQREFNRTQGRNWYIPPISANKITARKLFDYFKPDDPKYVKAIDTFLNLMEVSKYRPVTPVGQLLWDEHARALDEATLHIMTPKQALDEGTKKVQAELDHIYKQKKHPLLNIGYTVLFIIAIFLIILLILWKKYHLQFPKSKMAKEENRAGWIMAFPWIFGFLFFILGPMIASIILSFCEYDVLHPAKIIGLTNFINLLGFHNDLATGFEANDSSFWYSLWNTIYISAIGVPLSMILGLAIAMLLNTKVKGMQIYRTLYYLPSIVPVVATTIVWQWLLNPQTGLLAVLLSKIGIPSPSWIGDPAWTKPALILILLWGSGANMIIWLAGLKGIPDVYYEAAEIDGSNWWHKFWNITIPMLTPYIFFNLIMGIIGYFQIFTQAYILGGEDPSHAGPADSLLFYVFYLFNNAFTYFKMGYACAMAWILFFIILGLTLVQLKLAPRWVHYETEE